MSSVKVLCMKCGSHLFNASLGGLGFPLKMEMFEFLHGGMCRRSGDVGLDLYCPVCGLFPFWYDVSSGYRGVGDRLKIEGIGGRPVVLTVEELVSDRDGVLVEDDGGAGGDGEGGDRDSEDGPRVGGVRGRARGGVGRSRSVKSVRGVVSSDEAAVLDDDLLSLPENLRFDDVPRWVVAQVEKASGDEEVGDSFVDKLNWPPTDDPPTVEQLRALLSNVRALKRHPEVGAMLLKPLYGKAHVLSVSYGGDGDGSSSNSEGDDTSDGVCQVVIGKEKEEKPFVLPRKEKKYRRLK